MVAIGGHVRTIGGVRTRRPNLCPLLESDCVEKIGTDTPIEIEGDIDDGNALDTAPDLGQKKASRSRDVQFQVTTIVSRADSRHTDIVFLYNEKKYEWQYHLLQEALEYTKSKCRLFGNLEEHYLKEHYLLYQHKFGSIREMFNLIKGRGTFARQRMMILLKIEKLRKMVCLSERITSEHRCRIDRVLRILKKFYQMHRSTHDQLKVTGFYKLSKFYLKHRNSEIKDNKLDGRFDISSKVKLFEALMLDSKDNLIRDYEEELPDHELWGHSNQHVSSSVSRQNKGRRKIYFGSTHAIHSSVSYRYHSSTLRHHISTRRQQRSSFRYHAHRHMRRSSSIGMATPGLIRRRRSNIQDCSLYYTSPAEETYDCDRLEKPTNSIKQEVDSFSNDGREVSLLGPTMANSFGDLLNLEITVTTN